MILIKTSADTLQAVLREAKHALPGKPQRASTGDTILVAQTKSTLRPGQKPIRWIMDYLDAYEDVGGESERIWGKQWRYIIEATNVREIEPFDIKEIKVSDKDYGAAQGLCYVSPEDESEILRWIGEEIFAQRDDRSEAAEEFEAHRVLKAEELIAKLDRKYAGTPQYVKRVVWQAQRPSSLRSAILERDGTTCRICGYEGFPKRSGGKYAETHHMIEINKQAPDTLQSWNMIVVCPLCHKKLHHANVKTLYLDPGWKVTIDGEECTIR